MKPYTHHFKPFHADRVAGIRLNRELGVQEARAALISKKSGKKKSGTQTKKKSKKYHLTPQMRANIEAADPEVRDFLLGLSE